MPPLLRLAMKSWVGEPVRKGTDKERGHAPFPTLS